jgi:23S rRNA pseudouridine1911/1915/1917 synthase
MSAIGHPVVGDDRYGGGSNEPALARGRFFLHAFELGFDHPADGHRASFRSELPDDLVALLGERPGLS